MKSRGRPLTRTLFTEERRLLAGMIDDALRAGQRGDGTPSSRWRPWTGVAFADAVRAAASSINDWRDRENPIRPGNILPILHAFYGNVPAYAEAKQSMLTAWKRAGGIDADDPPEPRTITTKQFSEIAEVVTLLVNQPTPDNNGNLIVPYTLRLRCDDNVEISMKVDGRPVTVTMEIGLTALLFVIESGEWQPKEETIFRRGKHPNAKPGPFGDSVLLTGPTDNHGRIVGEPFEDVPNLLLERTGRDGPVTLSVKVPRDGFSVTLPDASPPSATQKDVLDAIFAQGVPRDAKNRLEVANVHVAPHTIKVRP